MSKHFSTMAHFFNKDKLTPGEYSISRKYNGMGCISDGGLSQGYPASDFPWYDQAGDKPGVIATGLWSIRDGKTKVINAPGYFIRALPKYIPLQGELWCNDDLQYVMSTCKKKKPNPKEWEKIAFISYNIKPYELWEGVTKKSLPKSRQCFYTNDIWTEMWVHYNNCNVKENDYYRLATNALWTYEDITSGLGHLIEGVSKNGYEGLMFQRIDAKYEMKRTWNLMKMKGKYDCEATVTGYIEGEGKYEGMCGSINISLTWDDKIISIHGGKESHIGTTVESKVAGFTDEERSWDYIKRTFPIGSEIPFTFSYVSKYGVPSSCNIKRN